MAYFGLYIMPESPDFWYNSMICSLRCVLFVSERFCFFANLYFIITIRCPYKPPSRPIWAARDELLIIWFCVERGGRIILLPRPRAWPAR